MRVQYRLRLKLSGFADLPYFIVSFFHKDIDWISHVCLSCLKRGKHITFQMLEGVEMPFMVLASVRGHKCTELHLGCCHCNDSKETTFFTSYELNFKNHWCLWRGLPNLWGFKKWNNMLGTICPSFKPMKISMVFQLTLNFSNLALSISHNSERWNKTTLWNLFSAVK